MTMYLIFDEVEWSGKTKKVAVVSAQHGATLGWIKWYGAWRQYAFFPLADTIWNPDCLKAVNTMIQTLMAERKRGDG